MALKLISILIDEKGDADVSLDGFAGKGCEAIVKGFEAAIGGADGGIKHNADFNKPSLTKTRLTQGS